MSQPSLGISQPQSNRIGLGAGLEMLDREIVFCHRFAAMRVHNPTSNFLAIAVALASRSDLQEAAARGR